MTKTEARFDRAAAPPESTAWTGWIVFASIMLAIVGLINIVQGLTALLDETYYVAASSEGLLIGDLTVWGVVLLIWGGAQVAAGMGLNSGHGWARVLALIIASVGIVIQMVLVSAQPIWSLVIIALDVVVIFALTVYWQEARAGL